MKFANAKLGSALLIFTFVASQLFADAPRFLATGEPEVAERGPHHLVRQSVSQYLTVYVHVTAT
ncbi:MAG TPA: hypothetical protein VKM56_01745 [Verrucomicrobiae bacterium]|nr:hypothetical protein [Verrucomicrobiae bacterium]